MACYMFDAKPLFEPFWFIVDQTLENKFASKYNLFQTKH